MEQSQLTIMAYLNDAFTGGNTNFLDETVKPPAVTHALKPETGRCLECLRYVSIVRCNGVSGMVLIFQHDMFHEGEAISTGKKYIMRRSVTRSKGRRLKLFFSCNGNQ
jgi:hypothetical protein